MFIKTKIGIGALILAAFIIGGFAFNAYQVGAFRGGHMFGFFGDGCDLSGLEKDSPEWQLKMDECKAEREAKKEEWRAEMGAWKDITAEERKVKMEEFEASRLERSENCEWKGRDLGFFGFRGLKGFTNGTNYEIANLNNGVQITITSDSSDIVQKLHDFAEKYNK